MPRYSTAKPRQALRFIREMRRNTGSVSQIPTIFMNKCALSSESDVWFLYSPLKHVPHYHGDPVRARTRDMYPQVLFSDWSEM
jgi:hypothetical protein